MKTQNILSDDNIDKIISTYRNRISEDKYSHVASLEEIAENEYNLNIPRYVDTFEEEEPIDISLLADEIRIVDEVLNTTNISIASYCKELKIKTPF